MEMLSYAHKWLHNDLIINNIYFLKQLFQSVFIYIKKIMTVTTVSKYTRTFVRNILNFSATFVIY